MTDEFTADIEPDEWPTLPPREELAVFIAEQEGRFGEAYRLWQQRPDARWIADQQNVATSGYVSNLRQAWGAVLDGVIPGGASMLRQVQGRLGALVKRGRGVLSPEALDLLRTNLARISAAVQDVGPNEAATEVAQAQESEQQALADIRTPGIYASSYGWYLERPLNPEGGNTLIKVGKAEDVAARIGQHRRGARAHIPEPLVTIRVYATGTVYSE